MRGQQRFATIRTEGGLLPADLLARIAEGDKALEGLDPTGYHLAPGERLNEAASRSWNRLLGAWESFAAALADAPDSDRTATALTRNRWSQVLFQELGYGQLQTAKAIAVDGKEYPVSHLWGGVPVHLVGARVELDRRTSGIAGAARMSPHGLVQELLNRSDAYLWGFVSNGLRLRLLRDNVSLTRQAFVEFDLEAMLAGQAYADFVVLWLLCHQSRVEGDIPEKCLLERWSLEAAQRGTRALDQLRGAVESAIATMGEGFLAHPANGDLRDRLRSGDLDRQDYYRQLLRLVYRLLFVSVAEARDVLNDPAAGPTAKERYHRFYSLERIRDLAETRRGGPHSDLWAQLQLVFRALGDDAGCSELALPSLGSFLWSADATPDLDSAQLANRHLLGAVRTLSSTREGKVTRTVDYRNLGSEELGSVYESLLELHPELNVDARTFSLSTASGHERKTTGSYYTPTSLIKELLDSALDPVLAEAAAAPDPEAAILDLKVLDPAVGSGHFLIAAAHRIAKRLAAIRTGDEEPSPDALRRALRDVVGRCLHGIDINPMAVELCKVSLWMEAVEPGKPLSFLDHRIVLGNSLLGTTPRLLAEGIPDDAFKPLTGDDKAVVSALRKRNAAERKSGQQVLALGAGVADLARPLATGIEAIDALPDDEPDAMREKERRHAELVSSPAAARARLAADTWCAAFVLPKVKASAVVTDAVLRQIVAEPDKGDRRLVEAVRNVAAEYRFLHFHLAFPHIFDVPNEGFPPAQPEVGWSGGFDVVLGNPPWERVKLEDKQFFAGPAPEIAAAANATARERLITTLTKEDPVLYAAYQAALREAEGVSHLLRNTGRYPLCGRGDVNTYSVFAESMRAACSPTGRVGAIVPLGIATDDTTKDFFGTLVAAEELVSLFGFENEAFVFPGVHHATKFCLLTFAGGAHRQRAAEFAFFARQISDLADPTRRFTLAPDDFHLLNPNTGTCPLFRSSRDADLTRSIYRDVPVLIHEGRNEESSWGAYYIRLVHYGDHAKELLEDEGPSTASLLPVYEAKMMHQFTHRWGDYAMRTLGSSHSELPTIGPDLLADPCYHVAPRYRVREEFFRALMAKYKYGQRWFLAYRDVARSTDVRTIISAAIPMGPASIKLPVLGFSEAHPGWALLGVLNSFVLDYAARQSVGSISIAFHVVKQLPIVPPAVFHLPAPWDVAHSTLEWLRPRLNELTYTAWDIQGFALDLGYDGPPFRWDDERRLLLRSELDACFFHLYGIGHDDVDYIMETFPIVKRRELVSSGEYRTKRLILECYDAMAEAMTTGRPYQTALDPPPAHPTLAHSMGG